MPTQVTNYQCPACTGPLHFVGASGKLECDYCGSTYDVAEIEALYAEKEAKAAETQQKEEQKQAARKQEAAEGGWDTSDMSDATGATTRTRCGPIPARRAGRSCSATRRQRQPAAPTAEIRRSCRESLPGR